VATSRDLASNSIWVDSLERSLARRGRPRRASLELGMLTPPRDLSDPDNLADSVLYWRTRRAAANSSAIPAAGGATALALLAATTLPTLAGGSSDSTKTSLHARARTGASARTTTHLVSRVLPRKGFDMSGLATPTPPIAQTTGSVAYGTVAQVQKMLGITVDGKLGAITASAIRHFQAAHGLPVNGIVDETTFNAMQAAYTPPAQPVSATAPTVTLTGGSSSDVIAHAAMASATTVAASAPVVPASTQTPAATGGTSAAPPTSDSGTATTNGGGGTAPTPIAQVTATTDGTTSATTIAQPDATTTNAVATTTTTPATTTTTTTTPATTGTTGPSATTGTPASTDPLATTDTVASTDGAVGTQPTAAPTGVSALQAALHIPVDGTFGSATKAAVEAFQASHGLTVDGVVGQSTREALGLGAGPTLQDTQPPPPPPPPAPATTVATTGDGAATTPSQDASSPTTHTDSSPSSTTTSSSPASTTTSSTTTSSTTTSSTSDQGTPANVASAISDMVAAANQIATLPYIWGGGHGSFSSPGYDCSGSVSYVLHAAGLLSVPEDSTALESYGAPGPGKYVTIYANAGHAWMTIDGRRFDTVALAEDGSRWANGGGEFAGFVERHPVGF
jgi:peptidoglycan hydrolase-like protein with peptidoglycan-binding domain